MLDPLEHRNHRLVDAELFSSGENLGEMIGDDCFRLKNFG
jgi:hypothetical protein